jgi:hypothetical protein
MATTVVLPAVRRGDLGPNRLAAFQAIERRFIWQARTAVVVTGLTGFYMTGRLDLWSWFGSAGFWWMHAMVGVWLLFALVLFVAEPLFFTGASKGGRRRRRKPALRGCIELIGSCLGSQTLRSSAQSRAATGSHCCDASAQPPCPF